MAKKTKKSKPSNMYKATENYKKFISNEGSLTKEQHDLLLEGKAVDLTNAPEIEMKYLINNNLISKGE
tara:strand:+ start:816 stop:1019 length:204 start_codon:yes stop_codon:yes gene_type:complete